MLMLFNRINGPLLAARFVLFGPATVILIRRLNDAALDLASLPRGWVLHETQVDTFQLLAWGVAFYLLGQLGPAREPKRSDIAGAIVVCLIGSLNSAVGLAALSLFLLVTAGGDVRRRAVATVFGALFAQQAIVPILFALIVSELIKFDAMLVGTAVKLTITGASWQNNIIAVPSGHAVEIGVPCCSFRNVSLAALSWVALTKLERPEWRRLDLVVLATAAGFQILANTVRLYLIALSPEMYLYWHSGLGARIFAVGASAAAVLISVYGAHLVSAGTASRSPVASLT